MRRLAVGTALLALVTLVALAPVWPATRVTHGEQVLATATQRHLTIAYVHSIDRLPIEEDLRREGDQLIVERTRLREFGAGMGHIAGQSNGRADGEWWVVDDLARPIGPQLLLRVGAPRVDHRIRLGDTELRLSNCLAGQRVTISADRVSAASLLRPRATSAPAAGEDPVDPPACQPPTAAESEKP